MKVKRFFWKWKIQIFCILMGFALYFLAVHFLTGSRFFLGGQSNSERKDMVNMIKVMSSMWIVLEEKPVLVRSSSIQRNIRPKRQKKHLWSGFERDLKKKEILQENRVYLKFRES